MMQIWVDADACPKLIKEISFRAAVRTKTLVTFVANQPLKIPPSQFIKKILVPAGFDVADAHIVQNIQIADLVITADIPLANLVVDKGGIALNPRGALYTKENIKQYLSIRNLHAELRESGIMADGLVTLSKKDIKSFANCLDQILAYR